MRSFLAILVFVLFCSSSAYCDRIYIMNDFGYNTADPAIIAAIVANGHTVDVNLVPVGSLPAGFTTTCNDPVNGYDWLCFFGATDFSFMLPQIQAFIDAGGKVFCQYEVTCCTPSSSGTASILAGLTGLPIVTNVEDYIGLSFSGGPGWEAHPGGCVTIFGNAYKGLDNLPLANQLVATASAGTPSYTVCPNFGFHFSTTDFVSGANNGGITGLGDVNAWFDGAEPGAGPVNPALVDFFFPNDCTDTCYLFPPGCLLGTVVPGTGTGDINLGPDTTFCTGSLTLNASSPGSTYEWQDGSTASTFNVTASGLYWVEVTSPCYGIMTDSILINLIPGITVDLGNDTTVCPGSPVPLDASSNGESYLWQDGDTDSLYTATAEGIYWVQVENACGVFVTDSIAITYMDPADPAQLNDTTLCTGQIMVADATTDGATYLWQDGSTNATLNINTAGTYWVQISTPCFATVTDSITVTYIALVDIDLGPDTTLCTGDQLVLDATETGIIDYLWQDASTNAQYTVTSAGTYTVQANTVCGVVSDAIIVNYISPLNIDLGPDEVTLCDGDNILLVPNLTGALSFAWQDSSTTATYNVTTPGTYYVQATGFCGLAGDTMVVHYISGFSLGPDAVMCIGVPLMLGSTQAVPGVNYTWQDGASTSGYAVTTAGTYWLTMDNGLCSFSDTINVEFEGCEPLLEMPNVFSPNGDPHNNVFRPVIIENVNTYHLEIYNRWGQQVFVTDEVNGGWNGDLQGNPCVEGTYFWMLNVTGGVENKSGTYHGTVQLVR